MAYLGFRSVLQVAGVKELRLLVSTSSVECNVMPRNRARVVEYGGEVEIQVQEQSEFGGRNEETRESASFRPKPSTRGR